MKIAMVFFDLSIPAGGQHQFLSLAQQLILRGHIVKIYTCVADKNIFPNLWKGLDVIVVDCGGKINSWWQKILFFNKNYYGYISKAMCVCEQMDKDFDVINCHEDFSYRVGYYYKKIKFDTRIVWSLNNVSYFFDFTQPFLKKIRSYMLNVYKNFREKRFFKAVDVVAPLSEYEKKWCDERGVNASVVRSGVDFFKFYKPVKGIRVGQKINLLSIGALGPHRRFEDVINSVSVLRTEGYDVDLLVVCKSTAGKEGIEYGKNLNKLVTSLHLEEHVSLLSDGVSDEEMLGVYSNSHIFVHSVYLPPPQYYGWGLVVFEAMASGLPVILCSVTGATEVLKNKENALFFKPLISQDIVQNIKLLIGNPEFYDLVASNGQNFVKTKISWSNYTESMLKLFEK